MNARKKFRKLYTKVIDHIWFSNNLIGEKHGARCEVNVDNVWMLKEETEKLLVYVIIYVFIFPVSFLLEA